MAVVQELEQELEPKEEAIENLNNQLQEQDGELVEQLKGAGVRLSLLFLGQLVPLVTPLIVLNLYVISC